MAFHFLHGIPLFTWNFTSYMEFHYLHGIPFTIWKTVAQIIENFQNMQMILKIFPCLDSLKPPRQHEESKYTIRFRISPILFDL